MPRSKNAARKSRQRPKRSKEEWEEMKKHNPELATGYKLGPKTNATYERFYQGIGIVPEDEWETFLDTMRKPLPTTFRVTGSRSQAQELLKIIKGQYLSKFISRVDGSQIQPKPLSWYPDELAWQLDFTKKEIKNDNTLKSLHGFLISETESGNISRQEAVSMLPPLLMDIEPHHKILDMCAAPGSKTAQLIEMLHSDENVPVPEGYVVANDMDNKRCYLMTHQVKRIQSPNCMIINHDARALPNMVTSKDENAEFVKYDRVLCDVPCSGDGTMRKNPDIWTRWHVNGAYNLHRIQKKVLQRGLELLAVGGRLVYSTCSLNPIEDEAVVLTLIKKCDGAVELVEVGDKLPGLKYSKGTYSWKVMTKGGIWYETVEQAQKQFRDAWDDTMYPPIITEAQNAKLERCIRILPHQQNTGAFFIAVFQKTRELPWVTNRIDRKLDPIINPKPVQIPEEENVSTDHFTFGLRKNVFGRCNLCNTLLQGRNDYNSHKTGRKHLAQLSKLESENRDACNVKKEETTESKESLPESMVVDNTENKDKHTEASTNCEKSESSQNVIVQNTDKKMDTQETENGKGDDVSIGKGEKVTIESGEVKEGALNTKGPSGEGNDNKPPPAKRARTDAPEKEIKVRIQGHREDPFFFCSPDDPLWPSIKTFYDISEDFNVEQIMYRNMKRVLYFVSKPVRNLVICNDERVKFINLGVKCFSNAPSPLVPDCDFRLSQEGLLAIQHHVKGRRVALTKQDVITILSQENPFICKLSPTAQEDVYSMDPGSALFHFKPSESDPEPNVEIVFCGWRGKTSVRSFVGKDERSHYLRMCGVELTDIQERVHQMKSERDLNTSISTCSSQSTGISVSGTDTPLGIASGDEAELEQWNKEVEDPRGKEEDDKDATGTPVGLENDIHVNDGANGEGGTSRDNASDDEDGTGGEETKVVASGNEQLATEGSG